MPERLRIAVSGATGRMGRALAGLIAQDPSLELVGGLDRAGEGDAGPYPRLLAVAEAEPVLRTADAVLDFSAPAFLGELLRTHAEALAGRALVIGTTGLEEGQRALVERQAGRSPVLVAANFSVGVNLLLALAERAARALGEEYDIEIIEAHHRRKEDAPSGTALALGEAVAAGRGVELDAVRRDGRSGRPGERPDGEIGFHAVRGGDVVGEHQVLFLGERERVELVHRAGDRSLFAAGALRAARWLADRPAGRYTMRDVLGLS